MGSYDSVIAVSNAAPELDPSQVYGFSLLGQDGTEPAVAAAAFGRASQFARDLTSQPAKVRKQLFESYTPQAQQLLIQAGYDPIITSNPKPTLGAFASIVHGGFNALNALGRDLGRTASQALHDVGKPLGEVQHAFRAATNISDLAAPNGPGNHFLDLGYLATTARASFSPTWWSRAWRETEHGETYFSPVAERAIKRQFDDPTITNIARQLASGATPDQLAAAMPEDQRAGFITRLNTDTAIKTATALYNDAHVSIGRRIIGFDWLSRGPSVHLGPIKRQSLGELVAGTLDAAADWYGDPVVAGVEVAKGVNEARYLVGGPGTVSKLVDTSGSVKNWLKDVGGFLERNDVSGLIDRHPNLATVAQGWATEGIDNATKLGDWFKTSDGLSALMSGRVTGAGRAIQEMPHLSVVGEAKLAVKGSARKTINFLADRATVDTGPLSAADLADTPLQQGLAGRTVNRVAVPVGKTLRELTTLIPKAETFDPTSAQGLNTFKRLTAFALPEGVSKRFINDLAYAPNLEGRRLVYKSALDQIFHTAGVMDTPEGRNWATGFLDNFDKGQAARAYSTGGIDSQIVNGVARKTALLEGDLTQEWALPNIKELWANSQRTSLTRSLFGKLNSTGVDRFMTTVWKPLALLRLAFPLRVSIDELGGQIARDGLRGQIRARLADSAIQDGGPFNIVGSAWERMTKHLPQDARDAINGDGVELVAQSWGDRANRALRNVQGRLAGPKYVDAARDVFVEYPQAFGEYVSAVDGHGMGYLDDTVTHEGAMRQSAQSRKLSLTPSGDFRNYRMDDPLALHMYHNNLDRIAQSKLARTALEHADAPIEQRVQAVEDVLSSDGYRKLVDKAHRGRWTTDGNEVGVDATQQNALHDWAQTVVAHVDALTTNEAGQRIPQLAEHLLDTKGAPTITQLADIPIERLPTHAYGPEMVPFHESWWAGVTKVGFDNVVGRPLNWMTRQPMFTHNYAVAKEQVTKTLAPYLAEMSPEAAAQHVREVAMDRAVTNTIPYIHDPEIRSQFAVVTRNLAPFYFAQEQFYKRWARTFAHSPEALRQAQLLMGGLKHSGVVQTDANGNDFYMYPGGDIVQKALVKAYNILPGHPDISVPVPVSFSGEVKFSVPGLDRIGFPSAGPLVSIPLSAATKMFPELQPVEGDVEGQIGQGRPLWEQLVPGPLAKIVKLVVAQPGSDAQMLSAHNQAIQYLDATGHGLAPDATPTEIQDYSDRVKQWSRILLINRTLFGFAAPASPQVHLDPNHFNEEFRSLLSTEPSFDAATVEFMRRHPDASAYTVFQSKAASSLPLPATTDALAFMETHRGFLNDHRLSASAFFPQTPGEFDPRAYREQMLLELRRRKSPTEFINDVTFADAASPYFEMKRSVDVAIKAAGDNHTISAQVRSAWAQVAANYKAEHPAFRDQLESGTSQIERRAAREDLLRALSDPRAPRNANTAALRTLADSYVKVEQLAAQFIGRSDTQARSTVTLVRTAFADFAAGFVAQHPQLQAVFDRLYAPELP